MSSNSICGVMGMRTSAVGLDRDTPDMILRIRKVFVGSVTSDSLW